MVLYNLLYLNFQILGIFCLPRKDSNQKMKPAAGGHLYSVDQLLCRFYELNFHHDIYPPRFFLIWKTLSYILFARTMNLHFQRFAKINDNCWSTRRHDHVFSCQGTLVTICNPFFFQFFFHRFYFVTFFFFFDIIQKMFTTFEQYVSYT